MKKKVRWGILATGGIAHAFAAGLAAVEDAELVGVGSRSQEKADSFGEKFKIPHRHGSYRALAEDPSIDVVYVASPHTCHKEDTILCLSNGKAVLCEKPFAINSREAEEMVKCAQSKRLLLVEAMWSHFFTGMAKVREIIGSGAIGEVRLLKADLGFRAGWNPEGRLLNPALGGGSLMDVGVYTVSFAHMVFGKEPARIAGLADIGTTGVDEQAGMVFGYDGGALAVLTSAVRTTTLHEAFVYGTEGWIKLPHLFWQPDRIIVNASGKEEEMKFERLGNGYSFEAVEVGRCLCEGRIESEIMPCRKTLAVMRTLDRVRSQWGLKYAAD